MKDTKLKSSAQESGKAGLRWVISQADISKSEKPQSGVQELNPVSIEKLVDLCPVLRSLLGVGALEPPNIYDSQNCR